MAPTYFFDIDGTLIEHVGSMSNQLCVVSSPKIKQIQRYFEHLYELDAKIIICTGRKESEKESIRGLLKTLNLQYDEIITGCPRGPRIIVNDNKFSGLPTVGAIGFPRNSYSWLDIKPNEIIVKEDWGWRQLLDFNNAYKIVKICISPGCSMEFFDYEKAEVQFLNNCSLEMSIPGTNVRQGVVFLKSDFLHIEKGNNIKINNDSNDQIYILLTEWL